MPIQPQASSPSHRVRRPPVNRRRRILRCAAASLALSATVLLFATVPGASALNRASASGPVAAGPPARVDSVFGGLVPRSEARRGSTPVELGLRFSARVDGVIAGLRVYRPVGRTAAQAATLWTAEGTRLAQVQVGASSAAGWVYAPLGTPVRVRAGAVYVASYHAAAGHVSQADFFSTGARPHGLVHPALIGSTIDPRNGVFRYSAGTSFPTRTVDSTNYWVDVAFVSPSAGPTPPSTTAPSSGPPCQPLNRNQPFCTFPPTTPPTGSTTGSTTRPPSMTCPSGATTCTPDFPPTTEPPTEPTETEPPTTEPTETEPTETEPTETEPTETPTETSAP